MDIQESRLIEKIEDPEQPADSFDESVRRLEKIKQLKQ